MELPLLSGNEIPAPAASQVEPGGVGVRVGVHRRQHPLALCGPLERDLPVGQVNVPIAAPQKGGALLPGGGQSGDPGGEVVPLRRRQSRAQGVVPLAFFPLVAPFAAVVQGCR